MLVIKGQIEDFHELWNLVLSDPDFNSHRKRDRLPSEERLLRAEPHLVRTYQHYMLAQPLAMALREDAATRFIDIPTQQFEAGIARASINFMRAIADTRNVAQF